MRGRLGRLEVRVGFTLIELLVVVVIVLILASLMTAGMMKALAKARVARASTEIKNIVMAWDAWHKENNATWPRSLSYSNPSQNPIKLEGDALNILLGTTTNENKLRVCYLDVPEGKLLDPWDGNYYFALDHDLNDVVVVPMRQNDLDDDSAIIEETLKTRIAAWSLGKDGKRNGYRVKGYDDVTSWRRQKF